MARTRRSFRGRRPTRGRSQRRKSDWVFRADIYDSAGAAVDSGGTFVPGAAWPLTAGVGNNQGHVLYDSANYRSYARTANFQATMPSWFRAEGRRPLISAVRGWIAWRPSTWAVGSIFQVAFRFGVYEQNPAGLLTTDPNYTLWLASSAYSADAARWANDRAWVKEYRRFASFNENNAYFTIPVFFRCRKTLRPDQCFGVVAESISGSSGLQIQYALSTLVADEG